MAFRVPGYYAKRDKQPGTQDPVDTKYVEFDDDVDQDDSLYNETGKDKQANKID